MAVRCDRQVARTSFHLSRGASGAIRRFAGWVARGSVGHLMLEGINYCSTCTALGSFLPENRTSLLGRSSSTDR
ncbi:DUF7677 family protein [Micromonospora lupini]|uniref:DUF7677 family protein n=1 Tax=Micromonospora lupini TaxID=285679 RepID=UPI003F6BE5A0